MVRCGSFRISFDDFGCRSAFLGCEESRCRRVDGRHLLTHIMIVATWLRSDRGREPMRKLSTFLVVVCSMLVAAANPSVAAPGSGWRSEAAKGNVDYGAGQAAVKAGNYRQAIESLTKAEEAEPNNADVLNLLGFSYRKLGEFDQSLTYYQRALTLEPQHRGANEYVGELYLQMGDLPKAEERLTRLDRICTFGCEEYSDLKRAIKEYKADRPAAKGS
jgi:hypothetical protein